MRRILQCEINEEFFNRYGEMFFKSFYAHNSGWELHIADIGLSPEQRKLLQRYGTVKQYDNLVAATRWPHMMARLEALKDTVRDGNIVLRLDVDSLIMRSYDELVEQLLSSRAVIVAPRLTHPAAARTRSLQAAADILGIGTDHPALHAHALAMCLMLLQGTPELVDAIEWASDRLPMLMGPIKEEEPAFSAALFARHVPFDSLSWNYFWSAPCFTTEAQQLIPSTEAVTKYGTKLHAVHFSYSKYYLLNVAAGTNFENWRAWEDAFAARYAKQPWPDPSVVCAQPEGQARA